MKTNNGPSIVVSIVLSVIALALLLLGVPAYIIAVAALCSVAFASFLNRQGIEARERIRR